MTTDFGTSDWFVGSMKGVIVGINANARIVDVTHEIPAGDIRAGAFALGASYRCFPRLTVHVAVVDPGVGSSRAPIVIRTQDYFFVGPDNGLLSLAVAREKILEIWRVENAAYFRKPVSNTFHGRDVFATVAAHLTLRVLMDSLGTRLNNYVRLGWPQPKVVGGALRGEIAYIDRFGNAITNITDISPNVRQARVADKTECPLVKYYQEGASGQPVALVGSSGFLEIAINGGNVVQTLGLKIGDPVEVR